MAIEWTRIVIIPVMILYQAIVQEHDPKAAACYAEDFTRKYMVLVIMIASACSTGDAVSCWMVSM